MPLLQLSGPLPTPSTASRSSQAHGGTPASHGQKSISQQTPPKTWGPEKAGRGLRSQQVRVVGGTSIHWWEMLGNRHDSATPQSQGHTQGDV